jgi:hypothetical protein
MTAATTNIPTDRPAPPAPRVAHKPWRTRLVAGAVATVAVAAAASAVVALVASHIVAAAIVIPVLASRLDD